MPFSVTAIIAPVFGSDGRRSWSTGKGDMLERPLVIVPGTIQGEKSTHKGTLCCKSLEMRLLSASQSVETLYVLLLLGLVSSDLHRTTTACCACFSDSDRRFPVRPVNDHGRTCAREQSRRLTSGPLGKSILYLLSFPWVDHTVPRIRILLQGACRLHLNCSRVYLGKLRKHSVLWRLK